MIGASAWRKTGFTEYERGGSSEGREDLIKDAFDLHYG